MPLVKVIKISVEGEVTEEFEDLPDLTTPPEPPTKQELLNAITVTTQSGKTFDGNESSRNNMLSALYVSDVTGQESTNWKLADNTVVEISKQELQEALTLSIKEVGKIIGAT